MINKDEVREEIRLHKGLHYTYGLFKPDGTVFYVGIGTKYRVYKHFSENTKCGNALKKSIINKYDVTCKIFKFFKTKQEAANLEIELIRYFGRRDLNAGILSNMTSGGEGQANPSKETIAKRIAKVIGSKRTEKQKAGMRKAFMENNSLPVYIEEYDITIKDPQITKYFIEQATHRNICKDAVYAHIRKGIKLCNLSTSYVNKSNYINIHTEKDADEFIDFFHPSDNVFRPVFCKQLDTVFNNSFDAVSFLKKIGFDIDYANDSKAAYNIVRAATKIRPHAFGGLTWEFYE